MSWTSDANKAEANLKKHGVSFAEAYTVFGDPLAVIIDEPNHADRAIIIGLSQNEGVLLVVYAEFDDDTVRIISARPATRKERKSYEEGT